MSATDLLLQWSIAVAVGALLYVRGRLTLFHPATLYVCFHVVAFCIRPTLIATGWIADSGPLGPIRTDVANLRTALWASSAGLGVLVATSWLASGRTARLRAAVPRDVDRSDRHAFVLVAAVFGLAGCFATWWASRAANPGGWSVDLRYLALPIVALAILLAEWRWWSVLPFAIVTWVWTRDSGAVYSLSGAALLVCLLWLWSRGLLRPTKGMFVAGGVIAVAALLVDPITFWSPWRAGSEAPRAPDTTAPAWSERLDRPELAHAESLAASIAQWPATRSFTRGAQHLRVIRSDDRELEPSSLQLPGLRAPLPLAGVADGWMSGGWLGVGITLGVTGVLLGAAFRVFARFQNERPAACAYAIVQAFAVPVIYTSDSRALRAAILAIVPLGMWSILAAQLRKATAAAAQRESLREDRQRRRLLGTALLNPDAPVAQVPGYSPAQADDADSDVPSNPATPDKAIPSPTEIENTAPEAKGTGTPPAGRPAPRWRTPDAS